MYKGSIQDRIKLLGIKFLNVISPKECVGCNREGVWFCEACFGRIRFLEKFTCPYCDKSTIFGAVCNRCKGASDLESVLAMTSYRDRVARSLIHAFKYKKIEEIHEAFERLARKYFLKYHVSSPHIDAVVAVPLHQKRLAERGFNQAGLLALSIARIVGAEYLPEILIRKKHVLPQVEVGVLERLENVSHIFEARHREDIVGKRILLVDDVYTTGSTMEACARALKEAGAEKVHGFVVAR